VKRSHARLLTNVRRRLPEPVPDMTGWTSTERTAWEINTYGLVEVQRQAFDPDVPKALPEEWDAVHAEDELILARRAVTAAEERLARWPESAAAQQALREARAAVETAAREAEAAERRAEEAKRRPRPPEPAEPVQAEPPPAAPEGAEPKAAPEEPKAKRLRKPREPGMPRRKKQWWEERVGQKPRGLRDEDAGRSRPLHECIFEYEPLTYDDDDNA
jgi:hypothetical protein